MNNTNFPGWHGTTIIGVRKGKQVVVAGDGQVSLGPTVIKGTAKKVRRLSPGGNDVVVGFAGSTIGVRETGLMSAGFNPKNNVGEIDVRFVCELSSVVKDKNGKIIEGSETEIKRQLSFGFWSGG